MDTNYERRSLKPSGQRRARKSWLWALAVSVILFVLGGFLLPMTRWRSSKHYRWENRIEDCLFAIASVADALRAYHDDHGVLPECLDLLVPGYLEELPHCPEALASGSLSYMYGGPEEGPEGTPLLSCERHWEGGVNMFVSYAYEVKVAWKTPRWEPGERFLPSDWQMAECEHNLHAIGEALRRYEREKGCLPRHLAELVPFWIDVLPHCPADFVEGRPSYPYAPPASAEGNAPLVTCERHWHCGRDVYLSRQLRVETRPKKGITYAQARDRRERTNIKAARDALVNGSLPYTLCLLNERRGPAGDESLDASTPPPAHKPQGRLLSGPDRVLSVPRSRQ